MKSFSKYAMLITTLILCSLLFLYFHNLRPRFKVVEENYANYSTVNLSRDVSRDKLSDVLANNHYVANRRDADFVADTLASRLHRGLRYSNLYHLQKRAYGKVPALVADSAHVLIEKLERSNQAIGLLQNFPPLDSMSCCAELADSKEGADGVITVQIHAKGAQDFADIIIPLTEYSIDSTGHAISNVIAYAKSDSLGRVTFKGLDRKKAYSVLPIKRGFEYGSSKGIKEGKFGKDITFRFEQVEHRIQMIDNATLRQIKNDGTITVRTPSEFKAEVIKWFVLIVLAWWLLAIVMVRRKRNFDPLLLASVMFLSGLCVIIMFAIQNPLTEELRGAEMATGVLIGVGIIILFQFVDFVKLYQGGYKFDFDIPMQVMRWLFLPYKQKVSWLVPVLKGFGAWYKKLGALFLLLLSLPFAIFNLPFLSKINKQVLKFIDRAPKGFGWMLFAIILTGLLWTPLGKEIGGMKVNLSLGGLTFQPSEIAKYLILFFMAAFFTQNADTIIAYSQPNRTRVWDKIRTLGWVIGGLVLLVLIYAALGDMGPAVVVGVTFVLLYSLVKSKVNLENLSDNDKWKRIFTCDFAIMIYGIISFAMFIFIGSILGNSLIFALLWFVVWVLFGITWHKQFFESAFIINLLVFALIFGGDVAKQIPYVRDTDTAERFDQRTRMCINTWGDWEVADGADLERAQNAAVSNTQVANGLWAIATGGMTGQGLGDGNPNLIPAFHTDMILSSIGEQLGWWGLLLVIVAIAILLRRIVVVGYRVGHPFAFYFCMGVAVVTAVQFFIIALGSSGMIPLTGITVPFLSYGRVSMVLNLTAFAIVLSLSKNTRNKVMNGVQEEVRRRSVGDYNYPISIVTWSYIVLALFTLCVWQYYALWARGKTLVHPAFVYSREGLPIIEYNPRIALLTKEMWAGNIYDRNGVLLATSDKDKLRDEDVHSLLVKAGVSDSCINRIYASHTRRYYPFGEHLYFMLGDQNTGLFFTYNEDNPIGYMAEAQHLSYLRDYDNNYYDKQHKPVRVKLAGSVKSGSRYMTSGTRDTVIAYRMRDNSDLIKYLKAGINGRPLRRHNKDVRDGDFDLHLTLDAALQTDLQNRISNYVEQTPVLKNNNLLRISVVVLDAENGDLLSSANYPLPDYQRLREEDAQGHYSYSDNYKPKSWQAYTERDLGLTYQTMPGSTAKVMSAMSGFEVLGTSAADKKYLVTAEDIIEAGKAPEPHGYRVSMRDAIVYSSNCYFINLVNENDLYWALDSVYEAVGVSVGGIAPYYLRYVVDKDKQGDFREKIRQNQGKALVKYAKRIEDDVHEKMNEGEWRWAWGQGYSGYELQASPLNMARVASAVVNDGKMPYTQFLLPSNKYAKENIEHGQIRLLSSSSAGFLRDYMKGESANQKSRNGIVLPSFVGGKTGTPERERRVKEIRYYNKWTRRYHTRPLIEKPNDGWYMFFVEGQNGKHPLAVVVRMERSTGSGAAVRLTKSVVLESLYSKGYVNKIN